MYWGGIHLKSRCFTIEQNLIKPGSCKWSSRFNTKQICIIIGMERIQSRDEFDEYLYCTNNLFEDISLLILIIFQL